MNEQLEEKLLEENPPFELEDLNEENIFDEEVFNWLFAITKLGEREKQSIKLQNRAKQLGIKDNFKKVLNQYEKKYFKEYNKTNSTTSKKSHNEIANTLLQENNMVLYENYICLYENGVYKNDEESIHRKIIELVPEANTYFRKEVYNYLLLMTPKSKLDRESGIINFKNGLYDLNKRELLKHTPKYFSINQINTNINMQAPKVQAIDNFLNKISCCNDKRKQTILQMIGYSMTTSVKLQKAFILYGKTAGNGKTTLTNIIDELIGKENIGYVTLENLTTNKFATAGIKGKTLNIGSEMTKEYLKDVSVFKQWITGDNLEIEEKFKKKQTIIPYAKFIFNANELPKVADKTEGFYRRLQIIPFEAKFTSKEMKNFNFNELITKHALEYLTKISLEAYLNMQDTFSNDVESQKAINEYKIENNNILSYLNDKDNMLRYLETGTSTKYKKDVYEHYKNYCQENGYKSKGRNTFYQEILNTKGIVREGAYKGYETFIFNKNYYLENESTTQTTTLKMAGNQ